MREPALAGDALSRESRCRLCRGSRKLATSTHAFSAVGKGIKPAGGGLLILRFGEFVLRCLRPVLAGRSDE